VTLKIGAREPMQTNVTVHPYACSRGRRVRRRVAS